MISHCTNPECGAPFHYLRGGRLYRFDINPPGQGWEQIPNAICTVKPEHATVYFWLCEDCSATLSLKFSARRGLVLHRLAAGSRPDRGAPVVVDGGADVEADEKVLTCTRCDPAAIHNR